MAKEFTRKITGTNIGEGEKRKLDLDNVGDIQVEKREVGESNNIFFHGGNKWLPLLKKINDKHAPDGNGNINIPDYVKSITVTPSPRLKADVVQTDTGKDVTITHSDVGLVKSVNDYLPDDNGNVSIPISSSSVKTVNKIAPDSDGNIQLPEYLTNVGASTQNVTITPNGSERNVGVSEQDLSEYVKEEELTNYAKKTDIPDVSGFVTSIESLSPDIIISGTNNNKNINNLGYRITNFNSFDPKNVTTERGRVVKVYCNYDATGKPSDTSGQPMSGILYCFSETNYILEIRSSFTNNSDKSDVTYEKNYDGTSWTNWRNDKYIDISTEFWNDFDVLKQQLTTSNVSKSFVFASVNFNQYLTPLTGITSQTDFCGKMTKISTSSQFLKWEGTVRSTSGSEYYIIFSMANNGIEWICTACHKLDLPSPS